MKMVRKKISKKSSLEIVKLLVKITLDKKAEELVVLDVNELSGFADYFIILSGRSTRHVQGLASAIDQEMCSKRLKNSNTEGLDEGVWVLLDFNDVIVHIFYSETRSFYNLEGLWHDAPRIDIDALEDAD